VHQGKNGRFQGANMVEKNAPMNSLLDMKRSGDEVVRDHLWLIRWSRCGR